MIDVLCMIIALSLMAVIFLIGIFCFIFAIQEKNIGLLILSILALVFGVFLIIICPLNPSSPLNAANDLKDRAIEAYKDGDKICINGNPADGGIYGVKLADIFSTEEEICRIRQKCK